MNLSVFILVFLFGQCTGEPCARFAEIVGEILEWLRYDYDIGRLTDWRAGEYLDEYRDEMMNMTGFDITSASEREELVCEVYRFKRLRQIYDLLENYPHRGPYRWFCSAYIRDTNGWEQETMYQLDFVKMAYNLAKGFATWMQNSGFPDRFPPSTSHDVSVGALQTIENVMDADDLEMLYMIRGVLTKLLPIGPVTEWESTGDYNRSSIEEVVGWMEDSNNIFTYAGFIKEQNRWFYVGELQRSISILGIVRNNYDKILWYEEALRIFLKSNMLKLDTSDCPEQS